MSEKADRDRRPQQVTLAGIVAGSSAVVMLVTIGDRLSRWNTVDVRESFQRVLGEDDLGRRLGVSLDQAMSLAKVGMFVAAALAAAVVVLAVFAVRRDKSARVALSVIAVPMLLVGLLVDPLLAGFVVAGTVLLWSEPARDWYAGRAPRAVPAKDPPLKRKSAPPADQTSAPAPYAPPPAPGPAAQQGPDGPAPYAGAYGQPPGARATQVADRPGVDAGRRPVQLLVACIVTWVMSGLIAAFAALSLVGTLVPGSRTEVRARLEQVIDDAGSRSSLTASGISLDELLVTAQVMLAIVLVWALVAVVLAVLAFRGHDWARITLIVSAAVAGVLGLLGVIGALVLLVVTVGCIFVISRLLSRPTSQWYAARERR